MMAEISNSSANEPQQARQSQVKQLLLFKNSVRGGGGVIEAYTLQTIMSRRVILGAFVPESPTAKSSEYGM